MKKTIAQWYWESYNKLSWDIKEVTHLEFMELVITGIIK
jgi:hypothetical protein